VALHPLPAEMMEAILCFHLLLLLAVAVAAQEIKTVMLVVLVVVQEKFPAMLAALEHQDKALLVVQLHAVEVALVAVVLRLLELMGMLAPETAALALRPPLLVQALHMQVVAAVLLITTPVVLVVAAGVVMEGRALVAVHQAQLLQEQLILVAVAVVHIFQAQAQHLAALEL
jgi:hypothetical protein